MHKEITSEIHFLLIYDYGMGAHSGFSEWSVHALPS